MLCRVETHPPKAPCSVVAEEMGDKAMCSFMKSDSDDYWDRPGRHKVYGVAVHDLRALSSFFTAFAIRGVTRISKSKRRQACGLWQITAAKQCLVAVPESAVANVALARGADASLTATPQKNVDVIVLEMGLAAGA